MSNEKKVWVSLITQSYSVSHYSLKLNFPKSFNYPDYYKLVQEAIKAEKAEKAEKAKDAEKKLKLNMMQTNFCTECKKLALIIDTINR